MLFPWTSHDTDACQSLFPFSPFHTQFNSPCKHSQYSDHYVIIQIKAYIAFESPGQDFKFWGSQMTMLSPGGEAAGHQWTCKAGNCTPQHRAALSLQFAERTGFLLFDFILLFLADKRFQWCSKSNLLNLRASAPEHSQKQKVIRGGN